MPMSSSGVVKSLQTTTFLRSVVSIQVQCRTLSGFFDAVHHISLERMFVEHSYWSVVYSSSTSSHTSSCETKKTKRNPSR